VSDKLPDLSGNRVIWVGSCRNLTDWGTTNISEAKGLQNATIEREMKDIVPIIRKEVVRVCNAG